MTAGNGTDRHGPGVRLHPPVIIAISILAGIGLHRARPLAMPWEQHGRILAVCILAIVAVLAIWSLYQFLRARTDARPDRPDSALITTGPYRYSRNPLYIGLSLVQLSAASWLNNLWVLLLLPLSIVVITKYAIAREERYLEKLFGQEYLHYKARVRRWL